MCSYLEKIWLFKFFVTKIGFNASTIAACIHSFGHVGLTAKDMCHCVVHLVRLLNLLFQLAKPSYFLQNQRMLQNWFTNKFYKRVPLEVSHDFKYA